MKQESFSAPVFEAYQTISKHFYKKKIVNKFEQFQKVYKL